MLISGLEAEFYFVTFRMWWEMTGISVKHPYVWMIIVYKYI